MLKMRLRFDCWNLPKLRMRERRTKKTESQIEKEESEVMNVAKCKVCFGEPGVCDCPNGPVTEDNRHAVESETPRSDAAQDHAQNVVLDGTKAEHFGKPFDYTVVPLEFARQLERELNRSNQKCGELSFEVEDLKDAEQRRQSWNRERKHEAGYHENTSLDIVWAETLAKAKDRDQWRKMAEELEGLIDTCGGHGTPLIKDRAQCYAALSRFNEMKKG